MHLSLKIEFRVRKVGGVTGGGRVGPDFAGLWETCVPSESGRHGGDGACQG